MFTSSSIQISLLQKALFSSDYELPLFVRFRTREKYITVGVVRIVSDSDSITIQTSEMDQIKIDLVDLFEIVAFRDASGKPVFLTEFSTGKNLAAEFQKEIEEAIEYQIVCRLKYQDVYLPANCGRSIKKLMIRKQKKTEKDYSDVVKMSYDNRLAA